MSDFISEMEQAFKPKPRHRRPSRWWSLLDQLPGHTVRPIPSGTVTRTAYFRQPIVQERFAAVESLDVDEEVKREIRASLMALVTVLADLNAGVSELADKMDTMSNELDKHLSDHQH